MTDPILSSEGANPPTPRNRDESHRMALDLFKVKECRKALIYQQMETDRVVSDTKIAKLRALRLAKEENDRDAARIAEEIKTSARPKKKRPVAIDTE
jgi:hypothetical protein